MGVPQKVNVQKALKAKLSGQTYQQIATSQGVAPQTVFDRISPILKALPNAEELATIQKTTADHFAVTAYRSLAAITDEKLGNSSARDLAIIAGVTIDKHRLISGQSTSNQAILLQAIFDAEQGE
jgi:hypothetical protein